jgi:putative hemolysin
MIAQVYQTVGDILLLLILVASSAFFSGSETAFLNITQRQIKQLQTSPAKLQKLAARLLRNPGHLLNCLLFGNMMANVLFFAISSTLVVYVGHLWGFGAATALAFSTFLLFVLFGEILPKSLAYTNSRALAVAAALPVFLVVQVLGPLTSVFRVVFLEPVLRILFGHARLPHVTTLAEFRSLVNLSRRHGLIGEDEDRLLGEVIELGMLKVRHVMQSRVDMIATNVAKAPASVRDLIQKHRLTKIPVYVGNVDNIVGLVHLRQLFLQPGVSLDKLVQPVQFVPEQKTVESLLEFFRKTGTDMAVVVDEYGGIAGSVRLEDIAEELFGRIETPTTVEPIRQLGPLEYRLAGELAIHDWADAFGVDLEETRVSTVGGLVTTLLGRIPRKGDVAYIGNLKFTVERVRRHRIETVVLTVEPMPDNGQ